jgi:hypothetical protein
VAVGMVLLKVIFHLSKLLAPVIVCGGVGGWGVGGCVYTCKFACVNDGV